MKSYTDIEQSKKLAEILPFESADMFWMKETKDYYEAINVPYIESTAEEDDGLPCWSLTAMFNILPNENMLIKTTNGEYYCLAKDVMTKHYDNPVDACYEMIICLHELNIL